MVNIVTTWLDGSRCLPSKGKNRIDWPDDKMRGLQIRVTKTGIKTWRMVYKFEGKTKSLTLGRYPTLSIAMARKEAATKWVDIEQNINPAQQAQAQKRAQDEALTFKQIAARYMEEHARRNKAPSGITEDQRRINAGLLPLWGEVKAHKVTKRNVIDMIESVYQRGSKTESNRYLSLIRTIFNWAIKNDLLPESTANPAYLVDKRQKIEKKRDRVLSVGEIKTLWEFLEGESSIHPVIRIIIRLILLTGQRTSEICYARKDELYMDAKAFVIRHDLTLEPPRSVKNKENHLVMLAPMALMQFKQALSLAGDSSFVFPNFDNKGQSFTMRSIGRCLQREIKAGNLKIEPVHSRDLRRTFKTNLKTMRVDLELRDMITNHKGNQSVGQRSYEWEDLQEERLAVMEKWEARLQDIIAGKQVKSHGLRIQAG